MSDIGQGTKAIVRRFSDKLFGREIDSIRRHNDLFSRFDTAYFGKFGRVIAQKYLSLCSGEKPSMQLLLVKRHQPRADYVCYRAEISAAQRHRPKSHYIHRYYRDRPNICCWFKLGTPSFKQTPSQKTNSTVRTASPLQSLDDFLEFSADYEFQS